jgi:hypothetical protein
MPPLTEAVETTLKELVIAMRWQRRHLSLLSITIFERSDLMKSLSRRLKIVLRGILIVILSGSFAGVPVLHAEEPAQPN